MKNKLKKLAAVLMAAAVVATLVGCGNTTDDKQETSKSTQVAESSKKEETPKSTEEAKEFSYPVEGDVTLTMTGFLSTAVEAYGVKNWADTEIAKAMEEATGIHVDFDHGNGEYSEWFNLMLADGKYTDMIGGNFSNYAGGAAGAAADGIIIPLNDVIDQYMPNLKAYLEANPDLDKKIKTDDGTYYYIPAFTSDVRMGNTHGAFIRKDWLDELKIEMPETIDQWHDALVKLKEAKGVAPISVQAGNLLKYGAFENAYAPAINQSWYSLDENGKVVYTVATDGYKEFLSTMAQWYQEGLIDSDIAAVDMATVKAKFINGESALTFGFAGSGMSAYSQELLANDPTADVVAISTAAKSAGDEIKYSSASTRVNATGTTITTQCENVEMAARWLDYRFSEEGHMLCNFGIEGVSYTMKDDVPTYTDLILKNPDGLAVNVAMSNYILAFEGFTGVQDLNYLIGYYSSNPNVAAAPGVWGAKGSPDYVVSGLSFTTEESDKLTTIQTDMNTHANEMIVKFLIGTEDVNTKWDEFVNTLKTFGMEEAEAIWQAAYDRLQAR